MPYFVAWHVLRTVVDSSVEHSDATTLGAYHHEREGAWPWAWETRMRAWRSIARVLLVGVLLSVGAASGHAKVGQWAKGRRMPSPRVYLEAAAVEGTIYAIGGVGPPRNPRLKTVEAYDIEDDDWTARADMLVGWAPSAATALRGEIFVVGSHGFPGRVEAYDPAADTWRERAELPLSRVEGHGLALAVVKHHMLAIGGDPGLHGKRVSSAVHSYDPMLDEWTPRADMPTARTALVVGVVNGKVYAIGGVNDGHSAAVEEYDPVADRWTKKRDMPTPRGGSGLAVVNRLIYVIGGMEEGGAGSYAVEVYDPSRNAWRRLEDLPHPRSSAPAVTHEGRIYVLGGQTGGGPAPIVDTVLVYDTGFRGPFAVSPREALITTWSALKAE
jgi:N-acetylneuraminic acid mutarotase